MPPFAVISPVTVNEPSVPTVVSDDVTTPAPSVVPVSVPAGATTTLPEAAVISPLALTVKDGIDVDDIHSDVFMLSEDGDLIDEGSEHDTLKETP